MSKKKHHHEEHVDESWLIPYADLLTLLLALFIALYAMSVSDTAKLKKMSEAFKNAIAGGMGVLDFTSPASPESASEVERDWQMIQEAEELEKTKAQIDQYAKDTGLDKQIETQITAEGLTINIRDAALFDSGRADLRPEAQALVGEIAKSMAGQKNEIRVSGHTDNLPINTPEFPSNWDLSSKRAVNVVKRMLDAAPVEPKRFMTSGYGEFRPKSDNNTAEGRAANRRVEILVVRQHSLTGGVGATGGTPGAGGLGAGAGTQPARPDTPLPTPAPGPLQTQTPAAAPGPPQAAAPPPQPAHQ